MLGGAEVPLPFLMVPESWHCLGREAHAQDAVKFGQHEGPQGQLRDLAKGLCDCDPTHLWEEGAPGETKPTAHPLVRVRSRPPHEGP